MRFGSDRNLSRYLSLAWDMPVYQAFSEIIALIISWSTLRTDSISQTEPEGMACKQSPFEDSGGVVSTTVDDGLT